MRRYILLILALAAILVVPSSAWLSGYTYKQSHNLTGNDGWSVNQSNYAVQFLVNTGKGTSSGNTIYLNNHAQSDLDDLRITDSSDNILDYWIASDTTSNPYTVWVEVNTIYKTGNTTLLFYYGNESVSGVSNGYDVFPFFDPFDSLNATVWDTTGSVSVTDGNMIVYSNSADDDIASAEGFSGANSLNKVTRIRAKFNPWGSTSVRNFVTLRYLDGGTAYYCFVCPSHVTSALVDKFVNMYPSSASYSTAAIDGTQYSNTYYLMDMARNTSGCYYSLDDGDASAYITSNYYTGEMRPFFRTYGNGATLTADYIFTRPYVAPEPSHTTWIPQDPVDPDEPLDADFSTSDLLGPVPFTVDFTDLSEGTGIDTWYWTFGDTETSYDQNPTHIYTTPGTYDVSLTVYNATADDTEVKEDYITAQYTYYYYAFGDSITAGYGYDDLAPDGSEAYIMQLRDNHDSTNTANHNLDGFGKTTSWAVSQLPSKLALGDIHWFVFMFGTNDVQHDPGWSSAEAVGNMYLDMCEDIRDAGAVPVPCMIILQPSSVVAYNTQVSFIQTVESIMEANDQPYIKLYDAIDTVPFNGVIDAYNQSNYPTNNVHPSDVGHYWMGEFIWDELSTRGDDFIDADPEPPLPPIAGFYADPTSGTAPLTVYFTDESASTPTEWCWDIDNDGDCDYDSQNCFHTYTSAGTYTVNLTVSNEAGSDSEVKTNYITVSSPTPTPTPTPTGTATGFHARATPSETIAPVDTSAYSSFIEAIGGDDSPDNETEAAINWTQAGIAISAPFTDLMGSAFFFVLLSIPFVAMWIAQEKTWIPLLTGIIVLSFATLAGYIPAEYGIAVMAFIALSIAAIVWTLLRSR
ncbi:MAG: DUF2341 domain-containing protein [Synergistaceae bacterium]|jgi:PKD repeat protein